MLRETAGEREDRLENAEKLGRKGLLKQKISKKSIIDRIGNKRSIGDS